MAVSKLDGAGIQKLKTLEEANTQLQRLHGLVETYALALKRSQPTMHYQMQIRRSLPPLIGMLKGQFGMIADQVTGINLVASRGGSETTKVRVLREGVASVRMALDVAVKKTAELHTVSETSAEGAPQASAVRTTGASRAITRKVTPADSARTDDGLE